MNLSLFLGKICLLKIKASQAHMERSGIKVGRQIDSQTDRQADRKINRQADRYMNRQAYNQIGRQMN